MGYKRTRFPYPIARIHVALRSHRGHAALISLLVVAVLYGATSAYFGDSPSPYMRKRFGVGGRDAHGELSSTLRRNQKGRAAVAIVRVVGTLSTAAANPRADAKYLVQVKSHDYPIRNFRGSVCLLGGNANKGDASPLATLKRELNEELHSPDWVDEISKGEVLDDSAASADGRAQFNTTVPLNSGVVRYLGTALHSQTAELIGKRKPYAFLCALYEITIRMEQLPPSVLYPRGANVQEGRLALLTRDQLIRHAKYAWGYEFTMSEYFGTNATNVCPGVEVSDVDADVLSKEEWTPYN